MARSTQPRLRAGMSSSMAELIALYSPPMPRPVRKRKAQNDAALRGQAGGDGGREVEPEAGEEQLLASQPVGEVAEHERADRGAGDVEGAADRDLVVADAERVL